MPNTNLVGDSSHRRSIQKKPCLLASGQNPQRVNVAGATAVQLWTRRLSNRCSRRAAQLYYSRRRRCSRTAAADADKDHGRRESAQLHACLEECDFDCRTCRSRCSCHDCRDQHTRPIASSDRFVPHASSLPPLARERKAICKVPDAVQLFGCRWPAWAAAWTTRFTKTLKTARIAHPRLPMCRANRQLCGRGAGWVAGYAVGDLANGRNGKGCGGQCPMIQRSGFYQHDRISLAAITRLSVRPLFANRIVARSRTWTTHLLTDSQCTVVAKAQYLLESRHLCGYGSIHATQCPACIEGQGRRHAAGANCTRRDAALALAFGR